MHMEDYDDRDGRKVWLTRDEVADVVADAADDGTVQRIAIGLMARSGLRSAEVVDVTPADAVDAVLTERGALSAGDIEAVAADLRDLATWRESGAEE